jgi:hypothetical protein
LSLLDQLAVGVRTSITIERPAITDFPDLGQVEIAHHELGPIGVADVADELALGVDEVALSVEVVVTELFDAD